jgi:2'-hydroxyisoflavone reductase
MNTTIGRRTFLKRTAAALALAGGGIGARLPATTPASTPVPRGRSRPLRILVLGGTKYVGPAFVREALSRNHEVTLFNRGVTNPRLFPGLEQLRGNRFPEVGPGLSALTGSREWDVVVDFPAYYPRLVEATARLLAPRAGAYLVMSSISVYQDFRKVGLTEDDAVRPLTGPVVERAVLEEGDWGTYGARKAACEKTAAELFDGRSATVRASGIVGLGSDDTTRYWPARVARGGRMPAPGDGSDPYQCVDVRDVARLLLLVAEQRLTGAFNATAPAEPATFADYLAACRGATGGTPEVVWLTDEDRRRFKVTPDETPQWAPGHIVPGFARISSEKARRAGWETRPLTESVRSCWLYHRENFAPGCDFAGVGFSAAREREILGALG